MEPREEERAFRDQIFLISLVNSPESNQNRTFLLLSATVIGPTELNLLLNEIEQRVGSEWSWTSCAHFMVECLFIVKDRLPPLALDGLAIAQLYLAGCSSSQEVSNMRVRCWQELPGELSMKTDDPRVAAIRAVICVLQTSLESSEGLDLLSFFLQLVNRIEPHYEAQYRLLSKHFDVA